MNKKRLWKFTLKNSLPHQMDLKLPPTEPSLNLSSCRLQIKRQREQINIITGRRVSLGWDLKQLCLYAQAHRASSSLTWVGETIWLSCLKSCNTRRESQSVLTQTSMPSTRSTSKMWGCMISPIITKETKLPFTMRLWSEWSLTFASDRSIWSCHFWIVACI